MTSSPEPPAPRTPEQPTPAEIARAQAAVEEMWPFLLTLVRHGQGRLEAYFADGRLVKWDAWGGTRHYPDKP